MCRLISFVNKFTDKVEKAEPLCTVSAAGNFGFIYRHEEGYYGYVVSGILRTQRVGYSETLLRVLTEFQPDPLNHGIRLLVNRYFNSFRDGKVLECVRLRQLIKRATNEHIHT
jgi:hypothetical protein